VGCALPVKVAALLSLFTGGEDVYVCGGGQSSSSPQVLHGGCCEDAEMGIRLL